jgi:hypothetical protein
MIDPDDYTLRWPNNIVAAEVQQLLANAAETKGLTDNWLKEAELLLRQAFVSNVPVEDFEQARPYLDRRPEPGDEAVPYWMSRELGWLTELEKSIPDLRLQQEPRTYWSQRHHTPDAPAAVSLSTVVRQVKQEIKSLETEHWFARTLGVECEGHPDKCGTTIGDELDRRVGKSDLPTRTEDDWSEDDLCDFVEVYHDLSARPIRGWIHTWSGCGLFHPNRYSQSSGQRIYRWQINTVLEASGLDLRLAEQGEDVGRVRRVLPSGLDELANALAEDNADGEPEVPHAIAMFRRQSATREDRRLAVVGLARVLEERRPLLKLHLLSKDESALFQIANQFDLRHRKADQMSDYTVEYLDWIFHWYLATIGMIDSIVGKFDPGEAPTDHLQ